MATYKAISGLNIKSLAADPSNLNEGDMWYNTVSNTLKTAQPIAAAWSAGGNYPAVTTSILSMGVQTAALGCGGSRDPAPNYSNLVNEYNGTSWTAVNAMSQVRKAGGQGGTQTAGIVFGGSFQHIPAGQPKATTATEEYDGTNWTTTGAMPVGKDSFGSGGTQAAAFGAGGYISPSDPGSQVNTCEDFNGSTWTAGNTINTARMELAAGGGLGTATAGMITAGRIGTTATGATEEYDGSTWTTVTASPLTLYCAGATGLQTAAKTFGGQTTTGSAPTTTTASTDYDGTSWTASAALGTARWCTTGAGTQGAAMTTGGDDNTGAPSISQATEEFSPGYIGVKTVTTS